ncbi:hypothetical protein ATANTOWER_001668 [Ataeniobius toweri]|uniref:Uncharacterized protein n=1 Tax=Ataeniobius toweri TaxID=208326 RepID=A0ABU7BNM9_9TELE|nr:hypothetical protein [Ataeniobius toweri]
MTALGCVLLSRDTVCESPVCFSLRLYVWLHIRKKEGEKASTFVCPYVSGWRRTRWASCWEHRWYRGLPRQRQRWPHSHMGPSAFWIPHLLFRLELTTPFLSLSTHTLSEAHTGPGSGPTVCFATLEKKGTQHMGKLAVTLSPECFPVCKQVSE